MILTTTAAFNYAQETWDVTVVTEYKTPRFGETLTDTRKGLKSYLLALHHAKHITMAHYDSISASENDE